ncbi:MAG: 16S rRNA (adenine(1518)-N(6)/adenine(1519)-N(6)) -dimethyltransferase RsmA [Candidatus Dojkabacteria bacterium]
MGFKSVNTPNQKGSLAVSPAFYSAKKRFGQNFFTNRSLLLKLVELTLESSPDELIEIGPGLGAFTSEFITRVAKMSAVEIDTELASYLTQTYPTLNLINKDLLELDLDQLPFKTSSNLVVFGALPYNISKKIIRKLVEYEGFKLGYFIIQKEVADKYTEFAPNANLLSLATQLYAKVTKLIELNPSNFSPKPKVVSTFIKVEKHTLFELESDQKKQISLLMKNAFKAPRKTAFNNLKSQLSPEASAKAFELLGEKRAQELTLEAFVQLYNAGVILL